MPGSSELAEVQEKLELLNIEYDRLNDEWTGRLAAQENEFQREKHDLLQDSSARLQAAKDEADAKNLEIVAELDKFRRAFAGDPLGWAAATDEEGKPYYYNSETGESDYEKPRILEIAEVMQNIDSLDEGKKKQERAIKKGKEAELQARKLEVSLNETRAEVVALRKTKKEWEACGTVVASLCTTVSADMDEIDARIEKVEERVPVVQRATEAVNVATEKIRQLKLELFERSLKIEKLTQQLAAADAEVIHTRDKATKLEERFTQAVEERVDEVRLPLEDELAAAYAAHQEEKVLRESDRRYLADLWPEGWLVPSILRRFRTMTPEERAEQTVKMEELEAERDLVEGIRAGVAAAAKWEVKNDDYGRVYYANWETGEAAYEPPPEMVYRPPLGRNELGERVDPRLQALREWEQGTDGWGKPFWQNGRTGEVVQMEPKGWSEAMGLGEHELEGWEGPTQGEVSRDVAVEAARVVVTWLNKAKEAEEKRARAAAEPLALDPLGAEDKSQSSEEDDDDQDEFVYDIQSVEELAMGDEGWCYQSPATPSNDEDGNTNNPSNTVHERQEDEGGGMPTSVEEIRSIIARLARREDRFEGRLKQVRRNLEDLAHDLLAAKRAEELEAHGFALGHVNQTGKKRGKQIDHDNPEDGNVIASKSMDHSAGEDDNDAGARVNAASAASPLGGNPAAPSGPLVPLTPERKENHRVAVKTTQAAGEAVTEEGSGASRDGDRGNPSLTTNTASIHTEGQRRLRNAQPEEQSPSRSNVPGAFGLDEDGGSVAGAVDGVKERPLSKLSKTLPVSLVLEVCDRAFPLALPAAEQVEGSHGEPDGDEEGVEEEDREELKLGVGNSSGGGVSCAAFHALAAEAVWAGLNGSGRVEKPPETVWDPRGGDRWGTAAFFAEQIGEREEEAAPGLPGKTKLLKLQTNSNVREDDGDGDGGGRGGCSGEHPLSGSSARHATARALCMAAVSSRRGFLKQAAEEAAEEARQRSRTVAENSAASKPVSSANKEKGRGGESGEDNARITTTIKGDLLENSPLKTNPSGGNGEEENDEEELVVQSAVMLRYGAEVPAFHAKGKCGRTVQFPVPDDWNDPEAQQKQYAAQMARRKEMIATLRARDEAPLARPKGYDPIHAEGDKGGACRRGCQDARDLLRYEAVLVEEALHQTLVEINETQSLLEEGRLQAAVRWKQLIEAEETVLTGLAFDASRVQPEMGKLAMEIRGLRVPLVEPQPPIPPTLDPGGIKLPPPIPDAEKMRQDEVDVLKEKIRGGSFDHGEPILLPGGKTLASKQLQEVTAVISERQAEVALLLEEETCRYNEAIGVYEYKHREWERLEVERKERLSMKCHQSRLDHLNLDALAKLTKSHKEHLELLRVEASADETMALQSHEAKRRFEATLAKQIAEEARAHDWLLRLQVELSDALEEKEALERLPDAALNRLDSLRWEKRRGDGMIECRRRVAELREALVEEGRRRRQLYEERKWAAQSELRRVLAERAAIGEKEGTLRLLLKVGDATLVARRSTLEARKNEAAEDKDGFGTEGEALPGEMYSAERDWVSEEFLEADATEKGWEENLAEMVSIRTLARRRESTVGELVLGAARGALPPPHPDQWLPKAEQQRHEDEVRLLLGRHERELRAGQEAVEASRAEVREAVRDAAILRTKLEAIEGWRDREILVLRTAGRDAVNSLKGLLEKQRKESATRIDKLEQALSEIRKEYNEVRAELTARIEQLNRGRSNTEAWVKALRHDLAAERATRENAEERLAILSERAEALSEKLRAELRAERMHSLRLELWIVALHDEIRLHIKRQEELKRLQALERIEHERRMREERHKVWRNRTSVRLLCTSVDSLFLFFAQRLANLAGSRRAHNDALRANGAVEVLAAICRGPRNDLRRFAARALGALGWNGHTEARVLAWDIYRHWDLWVQSCCPAEEARLKRRGLAFDGPLDFVHADEASMPASPHVVDSSSKEQAGSPSNNVVSGDQRLETTTRQRQQLEGGCSFSNADGDANASFTEEGPGGEAGGGGGRGGDDEEEFMPRAGMSAKTIVRARRQWALRRARRREGPNEANQLELGGGSPAGSGIGEAWVEKVVKVATVTGKGGAAEAAEGGDGTKALASGGSGIVESGGRSGGTGRGGVRGGDGGGVVALLARLCRERHDWEVVRAAAAALSVAAYHEDNADRMGRAAPDLIPVLVGLLPHPDPEVQAHAATALANLAHGSPSYQSEAGEAGAVGALLNICRGRAGIGGNCEYDGDGGARDGDVALAGAGTGVGIVVGTARGSENRGEGGGGGGKAQTRDSRGEKDPDNTLPEVEDARSEVKQGIHANEVGGERKEAGAGGETGGKWARRVASGNEEGPGAVAMGGEQAAVKSTTGSVESDGGRSGQGQNKEAGGGEGGEATMVVRQRRREVVDEGGEEGGAAESMDVDAVQAATAALANLLCYSEANSVRLVAAGGIGVLVGLVSSYRPQDLLDSDQAEEIQANAAEALVNATRTHGAEVTARIHSLGISPLVLMCGSEHLQVQRHAALVLGNVCQSDAHRAAAGLEGAVEGLFALCDAKDDVVRANALWALGNLAWDPYNQERIGRYTSQLLSLVSSSWLPIRTNALICLGNALFFHEPNRRRVETADGALVELLGYCTGDHPAPVQEAALRCLVSLTYVDRIVAPLVEAGCIATFVSSLKPSVPTAVRHPAALALLNVSVHDLHKSKVAEAGGVEAAVALLGSDNPEERELAARILAALACTEADDEGSAKKEKLDLPHLLGIVQMRGNLPAQKAAAEQIAQEVSKNPQKQRSLGDCGGVAVLLDMCDPIHRTEAPLLVPVLWTLRNCLHGNDPNKDRFLRADGLETLIKLCQASRSRGDWAVAEGVLTTLVTAALGNERICRRILRVGLDQLIDAAEDNNGGSRGSLRANQEPATTPDHQSAAGSIKDARTHRSKTVKKQTPQVMPGSASARSSLQPPPPTAGSPLRGPATDGDLGLDQIDEVGVDGVLQQSSDALALRMQAESRETCSALATSLLQALGPFNYIVCGHCGAREKGGTTCGQCGYAINFDFSGQDEGSASPLSERVGMISRARSPIAQGS